VCYSDVPRGFASPVLCGTKRWGLGRERAKGIMPRFVIDADTWMARLVAVACLGLMLGACTKCDVPTWPSAQPAGAPTSCHSDATGR
jgi:hypothetical protein